MSQSGGAVWSGGALGFALRSCSGTHVAAFFIRSALRRAALEGLLGCPRFAAFVRHLGNHIKRPFVLQRGAYRNQSVFFASPGER